MSRMSPRVSAGVVLVATLLPLCIFASPLRFQLGQCDSSVTKVPALSARTLQKRTTSALKQALAREKGKAKLVRAGAPEDADVLVEGMLERSGKKFRLVYTLQTNQEPKLQKELAYEFAPPRLNPKGMKDMARNILSEGLKLEEARKAQAAAPPPAPEPAPVVATAPPAPPAPTPSVSTGAGTAPAPSTLENVSAAPVAEAPSTPVDYPAPGQTLAVRKQPVVVIHSGLAGLWGYNSRSYGFGGVLEPKWNITDSISAGVRFDGGVMFGGRVVPEGTTSVSLAASAATLLKGEYLLGDSGFRPFFGLGTGVYILANQNVSAGNTGAGVSQSGGRFFGVAPQLGLDFGGVRLAATYNHILGGDIVIEQNVGVGSIQVERIQRNYIQMELSFRLFKFGVPQKQRGIRPSPRM